MIDIVERLRMRVDVAEQGSRFGDAEDFREAANEIERLQAALTDITNSMKRDWIDPAEHANWCVERAKESLA